MITDKITARNRVKQCRREMLFADNKKLSRIIADKIISMPEFMDNSNVYSYMAFRNEVGTDYVIKYALNCGKKVAIPKVTGDDMKFYVLPQENFSEKLEKGYMGIIEPALDLDILSENKGIIIVPGMAFDRKGSRIGYGRGFYDRFLAKNPNLIKIGIAFDFQLFDEIEINQFDIPMDYIITETELISVN